MPKIVDHAKRRNEIIAHSIPLFAREGYYETNLSQIASLCALKRTTIYKYFTGKDSIFVAGVDFTLDQIEIETKAAAATEGIPTLEKMALVIEKLIRYSHKNKDAVMIILELWLRKKKDREFPLADISDRVLALKSLFERLIKEGIASGEFKKLDSSAMAGTLFTFTESFVIHTAVFENFPTSEIMGAVKILLGGMKNL